MDLFRLISRSLLRGSWHLARGSRLAGCRGFKGPVPPPLWMSVAAGKPRRADLRLDNYSTSGLAFQSSGPRLPARRRYRAVRRRAVRPARNLAAISPESLAAQRAATATLAGRETSARCEKTS